MRHLQLLHHQFEPIEDKKVLLAICRMRPVTRNRAVVRQVLVQWKGQSKEDATWEDWDEFHKSFPNYHLEDMVFVEVATNDKLVEDSWNEHEVGEHAGQGLRSYTRVSLW